MSQMEAGGGGRRLLQVRLFLCTSSTKAKKLGVNALDNYTSDSVISGGNDNAPTSVNWDLHMHCIG